MSNPCMAITLIYPAAVQTSGAYLWCKNNEHHPGKPHLDYSGIEWWTDELVEPTPNMILWRSGTEEQMRSVSHRILG